MISTYITHIHKGSGASTEKGKLYADFELYDQKGFKGTYAIELADFQRCPLMLDFFLAHERYNEYIGCPITIFWTGLPKASVLDFECKNAPQLRLLEKPRDTHQGVWLDLEDPKSEYPTPIKL